MSVDIIDNVYSCFRILLVPLQWCIPFYLQEPTKIASHSCFYWFLTCDSLGQKMCLRNENYCNKKLFCSRLTPIHITSLLLFKKKCCCINYKILTLNHSIVKGFIIRGLPLSTYAQREIGVSSLLYISIV